MDLKGCMNKDIFVAPLINRKWLDRWIDRKEVREIGGQTDIQIVKKIYTWI